MAFDFLKAELTRVNDKIAELEGRGSHIDDLLDPDSEILANNLFGVDVNAESVEITKLSLWIKTARRGKVLDSLSANIHVGDSLIESANYAYLAHGFYWASAFPAIMKEEGGFDIVLGNPPYVRMEHLKALKPFLEKRYEVVSDRADLYAYFYERGLRLLKPGGRLGYISSSTFFKTGSGRPLREYLLREATIESVVDFGDLQLFEGVTTYPAIVTLKRGPAPAGHELRFWKVDALPESNFRAAWEAAAGPYPQSALGPGSWELENPALRALRDKIRAGQEDAEGGLRVAALRHQDRPQRRLRDRHAHQGAALRRGPAVGRAAEAVPRRQGSEALARRAARAVADLHPKNRVNIEDYPAIRDWLLPFKVDLEARATKQEWFELQQAQEAYRPAFRGREDRVSAIFLTRSPFISM